MRAPTAQRVCFKARCCRYLPVVDPLLHYSGSAVGTGNVHFLTADARGSIIYEANRFDGNRQVNAYDPFRVPDQDNGGRFGYTGQAYVPEIGMFYYKARMYSPTLGRFMKTVYDPAIIPDDQMLEWGRQAAADANARGLILPGGREWVGTAPNGLEFRGYLDQPGAVTSYFPNF